MQICSKLKCQCQKQFNSEHALICIRLDFNQLHPLWNSTHGYAPATRAFNRNSTKEASKKVKVVHTRLPSVGSRGWSRYLAVSLQVTWVIPGGRLPLLSARPAVTLATLKRAATDFAASWTKARWVWTVCLRLNRYFSRTLRSVIEYGLPLPFWYTKQVLYGCLSLRVWLSLQSVKLQLPQLRLTAKLHRINTFLHRGGNSKNIMWS